MTFQAADMRDCFKDKRLSNKGSCYGSTLHRRNIHTLGATVYSKILEREPVSGNNMQTDFGGVTIESLTALPVVASKTDFYIRPSGPQLDCRRLGLPSLFCGIFAGRKTVYSLFNAAMVESDSTRHWRDTQSPSPRSVTRIRGIGGQHS